MRGKRQAIIRQAAQTAAFGKKNSTQNGNIWGTGGQPVWGTNKTGEGKEIQNQWAEWVRGREDFFPKKCG